MQSAAPVPPPEGSLVIPPHTSRRVRRMIRLLLKYEATITQFHRGEVGLHFHDERSVSIKLVLSPLETDS